MSRWKECFQQLMFLYQLVNLVLETCFIFSKYLKSKQDKVLPWLIAFFKAIRVFWYNDQRASWFQFSRLFFHLFCLCWTRLVENMLEEIYSMNILEVDEVNCGVDLGWFSTYLIGKMLEESLIHGLESVVSDSIVGVFKTCTLVAM